MKTQHTTPRPVDEFAGYDINNPYGTIQANVAPTVATNTADTAADTAERDRLAEKLAFGSSVRFAELRNLPVRVLRQLIGAK